MRTADDRGRGDARLVLTCEHASAFVPPAFASLFAGDRAVLATHRGFDAGALDVARSLARRLRAPLVAGATTRLLVDLNRSPHNPAIFSRWTRPLPSARRAALLARFHAPHWRRVERLLDAAERPVVHVAVHSFTPKLGRDVRDFEIGLLYDPRRPRERAFADRLREALRAHPTELRIRRNAPYRGTSDGLTTAQRERRRARDYLGLELELNQAILRTPAARRRVAAAIADALQAALCASPRQVGSTRSARATRFARAARAARAAGASPRRTRSRSAPARARDAKR
ncbi:MAG: N-formylglutamate amidohydrolase [Myxococcota bacterium]